MLKDNDKKEFGGWWIFMVALVVGTVIVFAVLNATGKIGNTIVERKVFENSYQRSESMKAREAAYRAQLAAVNARIQTLPIGTYSPDLQAQKAMLETQIRTTMEIK